MNVDYDLLTWEGDILRLKFWAQAFDVLKAKGAVYLKQEGKLAGCWVMPIQEDLESTSDAKSDSAADTQGDDEEREKVIVRSNGVVTYVGKDIAYQFWKLGLLGKDFHYRVFTTRPHGPLWATTSVDGEHDHPLFGGAAYVYNVIDVRQSYLQKLLKQALMAVGHPEGAERSHHFSYEMVALSHATARELGYAPPPDSEQAKRPFVEVSGRKGLGVKADDLLDTLIKNAGAEVVKRNPELGDAERERIAQMIGIAAVRYFMIKFSRGKVIAFDLDEALSFEGESGPYVQYAVVRANNIFQKLQQRENLDEAALLTDAAGHPGGRAERRERLPRGVGARPRSRAARRGGRADDPVAGILGPRQVCVFAGAGVQRVLPSRTDSERRARRRAAVARSGGDLRSQPAHARPRPHGHRSSPEDVNGHHCDCAEQQAARLRGSGAPRRRRSTGARPGVGDHPADVVRSSGGVLLAGGGDVLPSIYGAAAHPTFSAAEAGRDEYEIELVRRALEADLPAVCDLPRHPGAERRARRDARAGHPGRGQPQHRSHGPRAARRHRARHLDGA